MAAGTMRRPSLANSWAELASPASRGSIGSESGKRQLDLIDIAPAPILTRLKGLDHWMVGGVKMLCGVLVLRGIATPDVTAD